MSLSAMSGETNLQILLQKMRPTLRPERFVFCTTELAPTIWMPYKPIATFEEVEGTTLVLTLDATKALGLQDSPVMRCITLQVHSSLEAVGLTAAVAQALKAENISANVIAAYYHDHVFVPEEYAEKALTTLKSLG